MKKFAALALTAAAVVAPIALAAPAHAGTDKVTICHSTAAGKWVEQTVAKDGTANGHAGHQDSADIIPAYSWIEDGVRYYFDGQNLDATGEHLLANGCELPAAPDKPAVPNAPTYAPAACPDESSPNGRVTLPASLGDGIAAAGEPVWGEGTVTVAYQLADGFVWAEGQTGSFTFNTVPITQDPLWVTDSRTGEAGCELADTGADNLLTVAAWGGVAALLLGAGLIVVRGRR